MTLRFFMLLAPALSGPLLAQGADSCAAATPIAGTGTFAFDNTSATTDGVLDALCAFAGSSQIEHDVWFRWTATIGTRATFSTCGGTGVDTRLAVYEGGSCGGTMLACNDDTCGLQSTVQIPLVAGQEYLVRVGTYPGATPGTGTLSIEELTPVVNPANGHGYLLVPADLTWDEARAAAEGMSWSGFGGHLATLTDWNEVSWVIGTLPISRPWIGLYQDLASPAYAEPDGGWSWVTGEPYAFTSWYPAEPNDYAGQEHVAEMYSTGEWNDNAATATAADSFLVEFDTLGGPITFCTPASPNSSGSSVTLASSTPTGPGVYHFEAEGGPLDQFAILLIAAGIQPQGTVISQGRLCLSAPIGRYGSTAGPGLNSIGRFDAAGILQNLAGTSATGTGFDMPAVLPTPPGGVVVPGATWHFQLWYRDLGGASNFSDGVSVVF